MPVPRTVSAALRYLGTANNLSFVLVACDLKLYRNSKQGLGTGINFAEPQKISIIRRQTTVKVRAQEQNTASISRQLLPTKLSLAEDESCMLQPGPAPRDAANPNWGPPNAYVRFIIRVLTCCT
jgi:hypothetical protein